MIQLPRRENLNVLSNDTLLESLKTSLEMGLNPEEVRNRQKQFGYNEVPRLRVSYLKVFLKKLWGPSAWMMESIALLSLGLDKFLDAAVATVLLFVNALIVTLQEHHGGKILEMLESRLEIRARAIRNGSWCTLSGRELVPGDIIKLRMGDFVPADLRILSGVVSVDQSSLTGESQEVDLSDGALLHSGSIIKSGELLGLVIYTGPHTFFGRTIDLIQKAKPKLHLEEIVTKLVRWLFLVICLLLLLIAFFAFQQSIPWFELAPLLLVLLMGAIPIALPVMFSVSTALGARELARKGVLITRLSAAEDAATMQVVCVDKTGTLTTNQLEVAGLHPFGSISEDDLLRFAALASNRSNQDTIDLAILANADTRHLSLEGYKQTNFIPFSPSNRKTESQVETSVDRFRVIKGALDVVLKESDVTSAKKLFVQNQANVLAKRGFRVLAIAKLTEVTKVFLGLISLSDPPRADARPLIDRLTKLGLKVKMLTGDSLPVAQEIATEVGLKKIELIRDSDLNSPEWLSQIDGFAEVYPEDKFRVITGLQKQHFIVGMTGDGVNDAPALKAAEVGIAVRSATDVARASSSAILTSDGLEGIVDLIENGRAVYQRLLTWIINKISRTFLKTGFITITFILTGKILVSALSILLLTFMTDFVKISLATDHVRPSPQPDDWQIRPYMLTAVILGAGMVLEALGLFYLVINLESISIEQPFTRTISLLILLFMALFSILSIRERGPFWNSRPSPTLALALLADGAIGCCIGLFGFGDMPALRWQTISLILLASVMLSLGLNDLIKRGLYQRWVS